MARHDSPEDMHELSIALSIVELAEEEAKRRGGARVHAVHLKLGPLSGVVKEALLTSYEVACENTSLAGSRLIVLDIPAIAYCPSCRVHRTLSSMQQFWCPECGTPTPGVVQGRELEIVALELEE